MQSVEKTVAAINSRCPHCGNEITMVSRSGSGPGLQGAHLAPQEFGQVAIQCVGCGVLLWLDSTGRLIQKRPS